MEKREARVYYVQEREDRKAILVFDAGHASGDVHIYEHKESCSTEDIQEEIKAHLQVDKLPKEDQSAIVSMWVEKKFGFQMIWKLTPE